MQVKESKRIVVFTGAGAKAQPYYINSLPVSTELLVQDKPAHQGPNALTLLALLLQEFLLLVASQTSGKSCLMLAFQQSVRESCTGVLVVSSQVDTLCRGPKGVWTMQKAGKPIPEASITFAAAKPSLTHQVGAEELSASSLLIPLNEVEIPRQALAPCTSIDSTLGLQSTGR